LPQHLTPRGLLRYVASLRPSGIREETAMRLLAEVGLESMADRPLAQLSDGQRRLAAVAQAFLGWPKLVLLDEFSAGLDVAEKEAVFRLIHRVEPASLVVITSNLPAEVEKIAQQLIVLRDGVIQFTGTTAELVRQAKGRVWEASLPVNEANSTIERYRLSRVRQADDGVTLRIVGTEPDLVGAQPVEPTLEDAYLLLMGNAIKH
jgi:ABC-type multidrug transport system ATPase subunit